MKTKFDQTEIDWINAAKEDKRHFAPLYERYFESIFRFVQQRVQQMDSTADLVAVIFTKAMVNIHQYQHRGYPFSSWLYRIALNEVNMWFRKQKKVLEVSLPYQIAESLTEEVIGESRDELIQDMIQTLNSLKEDQVMLIELRFFEGRSFAEMGILLGIAENTAKMRVYRAVDALKNGMERRK